jgi:hypothetical protein
MVELAMQGGEGQMMDFELGIGMGRIEKESSLPAR